jgi:hypothetical protein
MQFSVIFRLISVAKMPYRLRFRDPSRVKIFQQNPLVTKYFLKLVLNRYIERRKEALHYRELIGGISFLLPLLLT